MAHVGISKFLKCRANWLKLFLLLAVGVIAVRLFFVQIIQHREWSDKARAQHMLENTIVAERGEIYMMDGDEKVPVVMNETVYTIIVDPMIANEKKTEEIINKYVEEKVVANWEDVFKDKTKRYYVVAKNVSREIAEKIQAEKVYGISFQENTKRTYPEGKLASGLLGFVNSDGKGQYGVEGALNSRLAGKDGLRKTVSDVNNVALSIGDENVEMPAEDGEKIVLTVDRNIQYAAEKALQRGMDKFGASNASALVMNPKNGKILAVANLPNYNAAEYWNVESVANYVNYAFEDPFEPASVCKTFTFSAGINEGVMTPQTTYYNAGFVNIDDWEIANASKKTKLGTITLQDALSFSLNTGSIQALRLLGGSTTDITKSGREKLYEYYHDKFGFGEATGVELFESAGVVSDPNKGYGRNSTYANMTFGQNIQLTMVQVAAAFSSVINGGEYYKPTILVDNKDNKPVRRTISEESSGTMREMLKTARHTIYRVTGDKVGYEVGGKSGTAQVIKNGAYVLAETQATYIGFGNENGEMPEYVVMVRVWGENLNLMGGDVAMPIFTEISNFMLDYLKLKPAE